MSQRNTPKKGKTAKQKVQYTPEDAFKQMAKLKERPKNMDMTEERKFMFQLKELVWDFEQGNLKYVVFYHREKSWWQTGDNSMLIHYYYIAKQLGLKDLYIRHDNDYNDKNWRYGYITTSKIDSLMRKYRMAGYDLAIDTPEVKAIRVDKVFDVSTIEAWSKAEDEKEKRFNSLVIPKNMYPKVTNRAAVLHREIINKVVNLCPARQKYYGDQGAELAAWISYYAVAMANGRMEPVEYFRRTIRSLDRMNDWLAYVKKFDLFDMETNLRIVRDISELRALVVSELGALTDAK